LTKQLIEVSASKKDVSAA